MGQPGIVRQDARHVVEHLHGIGIRILFGQHEVVIVLQAFELLAQRIGGFGLLACVFSHAIERDRVFALLRERHHHRGKRETRDGRNRQPYLPASPMHGARTRFDGDEV